MYGALILIKLLFPFLNRVTVLYAPRAVVDKDGRSQQMILNGVIAVILRFSLNSNALLVKYVTVVEHRPTIAVKYCLPGSVFHFWP